MPTNLEDQLRSALGGGYRLERELGGGGMSRVFLAEETRLRRTVVVKVLAPELAAGINAERFEREIQLAASLQQANIVPVLSVGDAAGTPYYTMPYVEGESLRARLIKDGALPIGEAVGILRDVARALDYAHRHGVVHRDIKPDNVLLSGGTAVVTDFGIAKALSASRAQDDGSARTMLTQMGTSLGTPAYMAPEQAAGDPNADHRADIYAFGCLAYELLAGRTPFADRSPQRLLAAHLTEAPRPIAELRADTPPLLADLVMHCLAKDPAERPQSAGEVARMLDGAASTGALPAMPALLVGRQMLGKALAVYAAAFIVVALVARAAIMAIGLPDWVFPGALIIMALGLPVLLFTAYAHHATRRAATMTPALTPGGTPAVPTGMAAVAAKASPHLTWRRAAIGGAYALGAFALAVGAFMLLRGLGIGPAGSLLAAGKMRGNERVLVTDFRVSGADSSLGHIASEAVRTELGQSRAVSVVPTSAVAAALQRMRRPAGSRVDLPLAREIAAREGIKAILDGEIASLGGAYVVVVRLVSASGDELASFRATASSPQELIPTLDKLSRRLRGKIGESLKTVRETPRLEDVTTASLEALRKYAAGARVMDMEANYAKAIGLLEGAVQLDTAFAMAYRKLGIAYRNGGFPSERADSALSKAYRFRDRLTERERLLTEATYFGSGRGRDRQQAITAYEALLELDPENSAALNNLALLYRERREFAKAEGLYRSLLASSQPSVIGYNNLLILLFNEGKLAAAESLLAEEGRKFPEFQGTQLNALRFLYHRGRDDSLTALLNRLRTSDNITTRLGALASLSDYAYIRGRLRESLRLLGEARAVNAARGVPQSPLSVFIDSLLVAADDIWLREQPNAGVRRMEAALARTPMSSLPLEQRAYFSVGNLYALAGRPERARAMLAQYDAELKDTVLRRLLEPARHSLLGMIALAEKRPRDAVTEFRQSDTYADGPATECTICMDAGLGLAYDMAGQPDSAIALYERYVTTPYWSRPSRSMDGTWLAHASRRLGELYEARGDRAKAAAYYQKFVDLWQDADPDLQPKVADVRRRLERLKDVEPRR